MIRDSAAANRTSRRRVSVAVLLLALAWPAALPAAATPLTAPGIDGYSASSKAACDHTAKPGTLAVASILMGAFPSTQAVPDAGRACGTDHARGLAIDWRVVAGDSRGQKFLNWLFEGNGSGQNHVRLRRLGISYIIWNDHIWTASKNSSTTSSNVADWPAYNSASCFASNPGADCHHRGHIHISFGDSGGAKLTSWWQSVMDGHRDSPSGAAGSPSGGSGSGSAAGMPAAVAQAYVTRVYTDLLGRTPDAAGLVTWVSKLTGGAQFADVANGITASDEYRARLIGASYVQYLGRGADSGGVQTWLGTMRAGSTIQDVQAGLLGSDEFYAKAGGTSRSWVAGLYTTVLGRSAGTSEIDGWVGQLDNGASRTAVALGFLFSTEHLNAVIDGHYGVLLGRHADAVGQNTWVQRMQSGAREEQIIAELVSSQEYVTKPSVAYVTRVYRDVLGRAPDAAGLSTWVNALAGGAPYGDVATAVTSSDEYRSRLIAAAYLQYLGRGADSGGVQTWLGTMRAGSTIQDVQANLVASDEFYGNAGGTNRGWVAALYTKVLGRSAGASEIDAWVGQLSVGASRVSVARGFLYSTEHLNAVVNGYYVSLLGRNADSAGLSSWVQKMQSGTREEQIVAGLVASPEYVNRT